MQDFGYFLFSQICQGEKSVIKLILSRTDARNSKL